MQYVLVNSGGEVATFPYSLAQLRKGNPKTSFPKVVSDALAETFGVYLVVDLPNPNSGSGFVDTRRSVPELVDGAWTLGWDTRPATAQETVDALAEGKASMLSELAAHRWSVETGGVTLGGSTVETTREAQAQIGSTYSALKDDLVASVEWKAQTGWLVMDLAAFTPIAAAVAQHVQASFAAERAVQAQIEALTAAELATFDIVAAFAAV